MLRKIKVSIAQLQVLEEEVSVEVLRWSTKCIAE